MKYEISLNSREWEIIAEEFSFDKYYNTEEYETTPKFPVDREAWLNNNLPPYLHGIGRLPYDFLIKRGQEIVTPEPIFSIFDKENLTFAQMLQEICKRRKKIVKVTKGDDNPYE